MKKSSEKKFDVGVRNSHVSTSGSRRVRDDPAAGDPYRLPANPEMPQIDMRLQKKKQQQKSTTSNKKPLSNRK